MRRAGFVGAAVVERLHHIEMMLDHGIGVVGESFQHVIVAMLGVIVQEIERGLMRVSLLIDIFLIEIRSTRIGEVVEHVLMIAIQRRR